VLHSSKSRRLFAFIFYHNVWSDPIRASKSPRIYRLSCIGRHFSNKSNMFYGVCFTVSNARYFNKITPPINGRSCLLCQICSLVWKRIDPDIVCLNSENGSWQFQKMWQAVTWWRYFVEITGIWHRKTYTLALVCCCYKPCQKTWCASLSANRVQEAAFPAMRRCWCAADAIRNWQLLSFGPYQQSEDPVEIQLV